VFLKLEEVSKAIEEDNIKLAGLLTGMSLMLLEKAMFCDREDDDVELTEFQMKSKAGLLKNLLKKFGYRKSILKQDVEDLVRRTDLEEETILDVMRILKEEFDS
jgi:N utilization substance protein A